MSTPDQDAPLEVSPVPPGVKEMTLDDALQLAVRMHQEQRLDGARTLYERILAAVPDHPDALMFLGVLHHDIGNIEQAIALLQQAVERAPSFAGALNNLGNVLVQADRFDDAIVAFQRAIEADPHSADAYNNLGAVYRVTKRFDQARSAYERATAIDPKHVRAWNNLALLSEAEGDLETAMRLYTKALDLVPGHGASAYLLGMTFYKLGRLEKATELFRQWAEREPDNPVPAHLYAACSGQGVPERASDAYVEREFDNFAASFERVLNGRLNYQAPRLCAELLAKMQPNPAQRLAVLDAGCGTGLCGPLVAPWSARLVGVDLSAGMLVRARSKGVYDELVKAELTEFLRGTPQTWDLIVCADTLCYFGHLGPVVQAAAASLRPEGLFIFTVEALADDQSDQASILPNGRYAHGRAHIDQVLAAAGLAASHAARVHLRDEAAVPVQGWLIAAQRSH